MFNVGLSPGLHGIGFDVDPFNLGSGLDNPRQPVQYAGQDWTAQAQAWPGPLTVMEGE